MTANTKSRFYGLLVAVDVAKRYHDVLVQWPDGHQRAFKVANTRAEHLRLCDYLLAHDLPVRSALEPTADFHRPIAYQLAEAGIEVHLASSLACARIREALFTSWDKHDRRDAMVILYLLEHGVTHPFEDPLRAGYLDIQEFSNTYHQIALARTRCQHSLVNHYLALYFPEMERYLHTSRAEWFCRFLLRFPVPASIQALDRATFIEQAWDVVGRKVAKQRFLNELYELARGSMGLPVPVDSPAVMTYRLQIQRYLDLTAQRKDLERGAEQLLSPNPDYRRLRTLPGVGPIIALTILAESGDLRRFRHHRQYLAFCGFNLAASQSGQSKSSYRLSKRGNARLRYAFWLAAAVAMRMRENSFRTKYERYIRSNPTDADLRRKARTAVAAKMARVAHALIKQETDYRGYYEAAIPGGGTLLTRAVGPVGIP
ncbi:transposase [Natronocella acetinitrilica]|uniref:Transposase n=1 Tax=Natronocella acetinitrilica TaxID=414046 RepID=A0AAE3G7F1_9GAMM|nr:IS110 family transposase [Natronocella acetinitrilica]MCP1677220.1 transposase [Natronocella acetinitrilica]